MEFWDEVTVVLAMMALPCALVAIVGAIAEWQDWL